MKYVFIGPTLLAGIGQVTNRYVTLLKDMGHHAEYVDLSNPHPTLSKYDIGFAFVLPIKYQLDIVDTIMQSCDKRNYMTICETETVSPQYGIFVGRYDTMFTSSKFCRDILSRQFPSISWKILNLYAPPTSSIERPLQTGRRPYIFYTIGNIIDPRKNIRMLLRAFEECDFPNTRLLLKATCNRKVEIDQKNVMVINGLISDEQMHKIHFGSDCYINCSHSEGVGMGAVEAALHHKPVIITDYGGLKEYVDTPFVVPCEVKECGINDFLFTSDLRWGYPSYEKLLITMKRCYITGIRKWDHTYTENLVSSIPEDLINNL